MTTRVRAGWEEARASYWFLPSVMAFGAFVLAIAAVKLERVVGPEMVRSFGLIYAGGAEGARGVLSTIAGSVITVAGTTFSITIAALSLASGQFGPRLLRSFMRDRGNQIVLGTFTSTFLYCLLVLRTVRGTDGAAHVPHLAVTLGVVLAVLSVGVLIYFIHHAAESIQVSSVIDIVGKELDDAVERLFPSGLGKSEAPVELPDGQPTVVRADRGGYVEEMDEESVLRVAQRHNAVVRLQARPGDYVIAGTPILSVWPDVDEEARRQLVSCFAFGPRRTTRQDAVFAFSQLAEIAVRALSPGINDPFTAVMCVDRLTAGLYLLVNRHPPSASRFDEVGKLRVVALPYESAELVRAAFHAIADSAGDQPMVLRRLREQIDFLLSEARDPALRAALVEECRHVDTMSRYGGHP